MTRIIAGIAGGRRLTAPAGRRTRPTSDRAREGLFATLESLLGSLAGARFLDLYAGSGAVGLEALSRGAGHALLVESDRRAAAAIRANAAALGLPGADVRAMPVETIVGGGPPGSPYNVGFLDPPYEMPDDRLRATLRALAANAWLAPAAVVVVERPSRGGAYDWPAGFQPERSRRYGEGTLWYGRAELVV